MKIDQIANLAGVSKSAVSLALNGKPGVSHATREKILKIAKESGYKHKNFLDEDLSPKLKIRFLVVKDTSFVHEQYEKMPFFSELIRQVQQQCANLGFEMTLSTMELGQLMNNNFDNTIHDQNGVILLGTNLSKEQILLIKHHYKNVVVLDTLVPELEVDFVVMNNKMGIYQAVQHLSQLGHQRIGYIKSIERIPNLDERYESFQSAIKQFDLAEEFSQYSISSNHLGVNASFQKWFSQLEEAKRPTALLCENDYLAISVVKSLLDMDIKVPSQVSVVGFDNIVESIVLTPELSTVHVDKEQMAIKSVERLKTIMANEEVSIKVTIDTKFIARKSTDFI